MVVYTYHIKCFIKYILRKQHAKQETLIALLITKVIEIDCIRYFLSCIKGLLLHKKFYGHTYVQ